MGEEDPPPLPPRPRSNAVRPHIPKDVDSSSVEQKPRRRLSTAPTKPLPIFPSKNTPHPHLSRSAPRRASLAENSFTPLDQDPSTTTPTETVQNSLPEGTTESPMKGNTGRRFSRHEQQLLAQLGLAGLDMEKVKHAGRAHPDMKEPTQPSSTPADASKGKRRFWRTMKGENPTLASEEPPVEEPEEVTEKPSSKVANRTWRARAKTFSAREFKEYKDIYKKSGEAATEDDDKSRNDELPLPWSGPTAEIMDSLDEDNKQRQLVIQEIIQTEYEYCLDLHTIIEVFQKPLLEKKFINMMESMAIFSNIELLQNLNIQFYLKLHELSEGKETVENIGEAFKTMADLFKMYTEYCANHTSADPLARNLPKSHPDTANFLQYCRIQPRCRSLELKDFLIKPVQRVCKYPLLLRELLKATNEDHPDYFNLTEGLNKIRKTVDMINERHRERQNLERVSRVAQMLDNVPDNFQLIHPQRRLLKEGDCDVSSGGKLHPRHIFLFNDIVLIVKMKKNSAKFRGQLPIKGLQLLPLASTKAPIELQHPSGSVILSYPSTIDLDIWSKDINSAIAELAEQERQRNRTVARLTGSLDTAINIDSDPKEPKADVVEDETTIVAEDESEAVAEDEDSQDEPET